MTRLRCPAKALVLLASLALAGCGHEREQMPAEAKASATASSDVKVTAEPLALRPVQRMVGVVGTLHGCEEISLAAKVEGRVKKVAHDMSDRVQPGEILLEIDPTDYQIKLRQAQRTLQVELAKLGLSELPGPNVDVSNIPSVVQAAVKRDNAERRMERAKNLLARKAVAEEELTERTSEFRVAQAEYDNQVLVAKTGLATIQVKLEDQAVAKQQLLDTLIRVPQPSQTVPGAAESIRYAISNRAVSEGSYVMPGNEVFKVVIENPLKFRGRVPERKIGEVSVGQQAAVYTSAYTKSFPGQVTRISPAIDPETRTFAVEILVANDQAELKPGGFAKTAILTHVDKQTPTVPLEAPVHLAGVTKIFLVEGGKAKEVQVTLGVQGTDWVEIASPKLPADALVVTSGQTAIADGTAVAIREVPPQASPADDEPAAPPTFDEPPAEGETEPAGPVARKETSP